MNSSTKRNKKKNSKYGFKQKWWQLIRERGVRWTGALRSHQFILQTSSLDTESDPLLESDKGLRSC